MLKEIEAFIPVLRETYRLITEYQLNRNEENEVKLRLQLMHATKEMQKFKPLMQRKWRVYLEVLENQQRFPMSDLISALDCTIHQMHLRAGNKNLVREGARIDNLSPWSREFKDFLNERRRAP